MIDRALLATAIAGVSVVAAGVALGWSGAVSLIAETPVRATAPATLHYHQCPGSAAMGRFRQGDRVYLTARDASGEWAQVRSPADPNDRVWVARAYVDPDTEVDLPVSACGIGGGEVPALDAPSTTAPESLDPVESTGPETSEPTPTTESTPGASTTTPATTAPTTTLPPTTLPPTTAPGTTSPPVPSPPPLAPEISAITRVPATIYEVWQAERPTFGDTCYTNGGVGVSTISARIADADAATMSWRVAGQTGSRPMTRSANTFSAVLGPFFETTITSGTATIEVTVRATGAGGSASATTTVTLTHCEGLG